MDIYQQRQLHYDILQYTAIQYAMDNTTTYTDFTLNIPINQENQPILLYILVPNFVQVLPLYVNLFQPASNGGLCPDDQKCT